MVNLFNTLTILIILSLITISGCLTSTSSNEIDDKNNQINDENGNERIRFIYEQHIQGSEYIRIYHDDINNVTCYTNKNGFGAGISCLKD